MCILSCATNRSICISSEFQQVSRCSRPWKVGILWYIPSSFLSILPYTLTLRNSHLPFQLLVIVITYKYLYHKLEWHSLTSPMMLVIHPHTFDYLLSLTWRVPSTSTSLSCQPTSIANRVSELVPTPWCEEGLFLTRSSLPLKITKK